MQHIIQIVSNGLNWNRNLPKLKLFAASCKTVFSDSHLNLTTDVVSPQEKCTWKHLRLFLLWTSFAHLRWCHWTAIAAPTSSWRAGQSHENFPWAEGFFRFLLVFVIQWAILRYAKEKIILVYAYAKYNVNILQKYTEQVTFLFQPTSRGAHWGWTLPLLLPVPWRRWLHQQNCGAISCQLRNGLLLVA